MPKQKRRMSFEFSKDCYQRLERLKKKTDAASQVEVIRRALTVYDHLWEARKEGCLIIIETPHGKDRVLILE